MEPGSFRDPASRVFYDDEGVVRALSADGLADWERLAATEFFPRLVAEGKIVSTELTDDPAPDGYAALLRHERIPFVSYPYEWPFGMLRDAALLQLELVLAALDEGMILKDASPYNVQWRGAQPVFIDVGSFEELRAGEPWAGYRQFCMLFLYPLLLRAYKNVPFQPWLRGNVDGIAPAEARALLSFRDRFRRGVLAHVVLHARLERRYDASRRNVRAELADAGFGPDLIRANVRRLQKLVRRLRWKPGESAWSDYRSTNTYSDADAERKASFVREAAGAGGRRRLVWDLGANDGRYARVAAESADTVVALDADETVVEALYRSLREEGSTAILPLVGNVADPSPGLGWRGLERRPLAERGRPDLLLCLALVHHLAIGSNVPLAELLSWLAGLGAELVVEFPTREDPMVEHLLARKRPGSNPHYDLGEFERALAEHWHAERHEVLGSGTRHLYLARPRV